MQFGQFIGQFNGVQPGLAAWVSEWKAVNIPNGVELRDLITAD